MLFKLEINGMTCKACAEKVQYLLEENSLIKKAEINLNQNSVMIECLEEPSQSLLEAIFSEHKYIVGALSYIQDYPSSPNDSKSYEKNKNGMGWLNTYKPLIIIFLFIALISLIQSYDHGMIAFNSFMHYFMAGFFIAFSFFKFLDLKAFSKSFAMYDPIAKRFVLYAYLYPFIELGLGLAYLKNLSPIYTNTICITILFVSSIGVIESVINKRQIQCACLGTVFNLPMSQVTIIENSLMILMASLMLLVELY
tara:strand:+ start:88 stop:846 length:759 start_codon:yes stop_codon:yes gene_type:complete